MSTEANDTDAPHSVRPAVYGDLRRILELAATMHDAVRTDPPTDRERAVFRQILTSSGRTVLVGESNDAVVGMCDLIVVPNISRSAMPWAAIENLSVDLAYRRQGYGRALLLRAVRLAEDVGCYKVQLISNARRGEAHGLYEALNFDVPVKGFRRYLVALPE